jgi:ATP-dependent helicase/nuclease subunit A
MSAARTIPDSVRRKQAEASDPSAAAFVAANAGSGKTHVLAQRVIRLLLDGGVGGVDPSKILCITFTKAAAANMAARVYDTLKGWIALDDAALDAAMREIGVTDIDAAKRARARRLFAAALETPGGLKVQTIHAFCTRILQQFPFEADVAARFTVLEERAQSEKLERATLGVLLDAAGAPDSGLGRALKVAVAAAADTTFREVVREAIDKREQLLRWITAAGGPERAMAQLAGVLGIAADDDLAQVENEVLEGPHLPSSRWVEVAARCRQGSKNDRDQGARLSSALAASGTGRLDKYLEVFFTGRSERRARIVTGGLAKNDPDLADDFAAEAARLDHLVERRNGVICRDRTAALVTIALRVIERYTAEKDRRGLLDYDDLIDKTHRLLAVVDPNWVHYKLDLGLDHVLIDEAQDTSEKQWNIIKRLVSEFAAGAGARGLLKRTVFAVGDEKQSIFSFQGAAPREYDAARRHFERIYQVSEVGWRFVRFDHSFRSGANVLGAVDEVFRAPEVYRSITSDRDARPVHQALPGAVPGLVEIWPLIEPEASPEMEGWDAPFDAVSETSPQVRLARKIALTVRDAIAAGTPVGRDRREMRAGDMLVLVRQRGSLFEAIIRALKNAGVAVAGADRLVLTEHIAIIDLMALADALLLPDDDLALAVALKSPLFGFDDDLLFALCWGRRTSLRATLAARAGDRVEFAAADALLRRCAAVARREAPFGFFARLLGPEHGRARMFARLGLEAADALDEFLELALEYERRETPSLQGFIGWLRGGTSVVKRDMETTRDEVRVMTVHGAKGLEAPVVILADTTTPPKGAHPPRLLDVRPRKAVPGAPACMVWAGRRDDDVRAVAAARDAALDETEHEYRRLLYVAMTRAAERLIVCGYQGKTKRRPGCWYDLVHNALQGRPGFEEIGDGEARLWRYRPAPEPASAPATLRLPLGEPAIAVPPWLTAPAPLERRRATVLSPSTAFDEAPAPARARPPAGARRQDAAEAQARAQARGTLIHRLLQSLPDVAPGRREAAANGFVTRAGAAFGAEDRARFVAQALAVFADARFAPLFAPGSRAEVPIAGRLARPDGADILVSGQIDRLVVTEQTVLIADYKTNHDPPQRPESAPQAYVEQLALYRAVLGRIYPDRTVRAVLLWTEIPDLMEIPAAMLDEAMIRITSGSP